MVPSEIPDGLALLPPGPGLASALAGIDLAGVANDRMLEVLRAQYRQLCHEQARMAAVLCELGRCAGFPELGEVRRLPAPERFAPEESRAALCWTRRAADDEHELAEQVVREWPAVFAAWLAGHIDRPRVRVFERYLSGLSAVHVTAICEVAVPQAARLTTGQLCVLLRRMVIAVDPEAAARWYREAVAERNVIAYPAPDGTITMSANGLPADEAEAACIRMQELASAAKRAGHHGLIGQIRCDVFLGMLDGRFHYMTRAQVIAALIADHRARATETADTSPADPQAAPAEPAESDTAVAGLTESDTAAGGPAAPDGQAASDPGANSARDERVGIEIRVGLSTLIGLDEHPAEIPGLGLLPAPEARRRVGIQGRAQWRFALTDTEGRLVFDGITRRRPRHIRRAGPPGGIVELHIPLALLAELLPGGQTPAGPWAALVADIETQYALGDVKRLDLDTHSGARLPGSALRRHTEIRDRTCTFMGCRRRAHSSDQDHTRDYHRGGATSRANLGPLCPHDHRVKHQGGWRVEQPQPGVFIWRSPLGCEYRTAPEQFLPRMPDQVSAGPVSAALASATGAAGGTDSAADRPRLDLSPEPSDAPILRRPRTARSPDKLPRRLPAHGAPDDPPF